MTTSVIKKAGLTESQAKAYLTLLEQGRLTPASIATKTGETRTNTYMVCEKLLELGLVLRQDKPKMTYAAAHPSTLEALAEKRRKIMSRNEQLIKQNLSRLSTDTTNRMKCLVRVL